MHNLKTEIGLQVRLMKLTTLLKAQNHATETEMWLRESQPIINLTLSRPFNI